jgi:lysophospholipase L1-like esterase
MKSPVFLPLALLLFVGPLFAEASSWPMPSSLPGTSATVPAPRLEWEQRVQANLDRARKAAGQVDWVLDGDSITDFWQDPRRGAGVFAEHFGKLRTIDLAIAGDRTQNVLWRLGQGQVDGLQPKLITLMIGTNNLGSNSVQEVADGVAAIVADYRKRCPDAVILLQAIFPRGASATDPARAKIKAINAIIARLADGKNVIYTDFGDKFLEPDGSLSREIMPDFLHPSAKGYEIWAAAIKPFVEKYVPAR